MAIDLDPTCPNCRRPLSVRAPEGLCPRCVAGSLLLEPDLDLELESPLDPTSPRQFGDYELLEEIARGGMGVVYRARQISLNRLVAVKMILAGQIAGRDSLKMFRREARAAANLHHPNIVPVFEIGEHDLQDYFTMRFVPGGRTIAGWAATQRGHWRLIAAAAAKAARAVAHAHAHGILHRDLKPSNILWDDEAGPQVTDFGLAKLLDEADASHTQTHHALGSPAYMAPEQTGGRTSEITTATDVYGLGAVLYELISGRPPFSGTSTLETIRRAAEEMPAPLSEAPQELETVCLKCLAKAQEDRYASAAALADDLERFSRGEPVSAVPLTPAQAVWRWARRRPQIATLIALAAAFFVAGVIGVTWSWRNAVVARRGETVARERATSTIVDLYTQSGLTAARDGDTTRAALWFAKAAEAATDPARRQENLERQMAWRNESHTAVRAWKSEIGPVLRLFWNPAQTALLGFDGQKGAIWDASTGTQWLPEPDFKIETAIWAHHASWVVVCANGFVRQIDYPSGREMARIPCRDRAPTIALSPTDQQAAVGGSQPFVWNLGLGSVEPLPKAFSPPRVLRFNNAGDLLLVCASNRVGICSVEAPGELLFPPVLCHYLHATPDFLGRNSFYTSAGVGVAAVMDAYTGAELERYTNYISSGAAAVPRFGSPNGRYIVDHGQPLIERPKGFMNFPIHYNIIEQATFSEDSSLLATACYDDVVRLVPLPSGDPVSRVGWHQQGAQGVAISPDKRFIATSQGGDGIVRIWRLGGPPVPRSIRLKGNSSFRLSRDGRLVFPNGITQYSQRLEQTRVYSVDTTEPAGPEIVPGGGIMDGEIMPDGSSLALISTDLTNRSQEIFARSAGSGTLQFWDYRTGQRQGEPIALSSEPRGVAAHPSGRWVAVFTARRELLEIDVATRQIRTLFATTNTYFPTDSVPNGRCQYTANGRFLLAWGMRSPPLFWDRETEKFIPAQSQGANDVVAVDFHGDTLGSVSMQSRLDFLSLSDLKAVRPPLHDSDWLFLGRFNPEGDLFLTGGRAKIARVWDWRRGEQISPALRHDYEVFSGVFVPDSEYVITGTTGGFLHFWNRRTGLPVRSAIYSGFNIIDLAITPDHRTLIRGGDPQIDFYDLAEMLPRPTLPLSDALLLAEIDAAAEIKNGAIEPLNAADWLKKWKEFQRRRPEWHRKYFP